MRFIANITLCIADLQITYSAIQGWYFKMKKQELFELLCEANERIEKLEKQVGILLQDALSRETKEANENIKNWLKGLLKND